MVPAVLLIIFNRPEHTRSAVAAMRSVRPRTILVAADGPRSADEADLCARTREVIGTIDWDCTVLTNYAESNLGCGIRVYTGIDWAFSLFEEVIVLEDDCVPTASFFHFCEEILEYFRDDERVMHIGSFNFQPTSPATSHSYYFSKYTIASGAWATWRRAWKLFDARMTSWPDLKDSGLIESWCDDPYERRYWTDIFDRMYLGAPDVWDYQWNYACWAQNGLAVLPSVHLATNHGFGLDATHTKSAVASLVRATGEIANVRHAPYLVRNYRADAYTFAHNFGGAAMKAADSRSARLRARLRPLLWPIRGMRTLVRAAMPRSGRKPM